MPAPPSWPLLAGAAAGVGAACWYAHASSREAQRQLVQQLAEERAAHVATELKRKQERAGRSKAEREKRSALKDSDAAGTGVECEPSSSQKTTTSSNNPLVSREDFLSFSLRG